MSLPIITADQRLAEPRGIKGVLVGKSGIGKTSQLWTLTPIATLFFDLEAGDAHRVKCVADDVHLPKRLRSLLLEEDATSSLPHFVVANLNAACTSLELEGPIAKGPFDGATLNLYVLTARDRSLGAETG